MIPRRMSLALSRQFSLHLKLIIWTIPRLLFSIRRITAMEIDAPSSLPPAMCSELPHSSAPDPTPRASAQSWIPSNIVLCLHTLYLSRMPRSSPFQHHQTSLPVEFLTSEVKQVFPCFELVVQPPVLTKSTSERHSVPNAVARVISASCCFVATLSNSSKISNSLMDLLPSPFDIPQIRPPLDPEARRTRRESLPLSVRCQ